MNFSKIYRNLKHCPFHGENNSRLDNFFFKNCYCYISLTIIKLNGYYLSFKKDTNTYLIFDALEDDQLEINVSNVDDPIEFFKKFLDNLEFI